MAWHCSPKPFLFLKALGLQSQTFLRLSRVKIGKEERLYLNGPSKNSRKRFQNENLVIFHRFRLRSGKANKFTVIFFCFCFRHAHVGHAQARTPRHTYNGKPQNPRASPISEPGLLPLAICDFSHAIQGKWPLWRAPLREWPFSLYCVGKIAYRKGQKVGAH